MTLVDERLVKLPIGIIKISIEWSGSDTPNEEFKPASKPSTAKKRQPKAPAIRHPFSVTGEQ
jgi:hypothetical protein